MKHLIHPSILLALALVFGASALAQEPTSQPTSMPTESSGATVWCDAFAEVAAEGTLPEEVDRHMASLVLASENMEAIELMEEMGPITGTERAELIREAGVSESCAGLIEWWESGTLPE